MRDLGGTSLGAHIFWITNGLSFIHLNFCERTDTSTFIPIRWKNSSKDKDLSFKPRDSAQHYPPPFHSRIDKRAAMNGTTTSASAQQFQKADNGRTLLLAPPALSSHPEALNKIYEIHDRSHTDLQMLDRVSANLAQLPSQTYDTVILLSDADGTRSSESQKLITRQVINKIVQALKDGGRLKSQDGSFGSADGSEKTEAILAGLTADGTNGMSKPQSTTSDAVPLRLGKRSRPNGDTATNGSAAAASSAGPPLPISAAPQAAAATNSKPAGVGFVDFSDDLDVPIITGEDDLEDDDLIDEDDLLTEADRQRPIIIRKSLEIIVPNKRTEHRTNSFP